MKSCVEDTSESARLEALERYMVLSTTPDKAFNDIAQLAAQICGTRISSISLVGADTVWFKAHHGLEWTKIPRESSFSQHVISDGNRVVVIPDTLPEPSVANNRLVTGPLKIRFYAGATLLTADHYVLGALSVLGSSPRDLSLTEIAALEALSRQVVTLMDLKLKEAQLRMVNDNLVKVATIDSLTALQNHRSFQENLRREFIRGSSRQRSLSLSLIDIDGFKAYNEAQGYASGDLVIKAVSEIIRRNIRGKDIAARYAGEEFALIMPDTGGKDAVDVSERIRQKIAEHAWSRQKVTVSIGVTTSTTNAADVEQLIEQSVSALGVAKHDGGNSVRHITALTYTRRAA